MSSLFNFSSHSKKYSEAYVQSLRNDLAKAEQARRDQALMIHTLRTHVEAQANKQEQLDKLILMFEQSGHTTRLRILPEIYTLLGIPDASLLSGLCYSQLKKEHEKVTKQVTDLEDVIRQAGKVNDKLRTDNTALRCQLSSKEAAMSRLQTEADEWKGLLLVANHRLDEKDKEITRLRERNERLYEANEAAKSVIARSIYEVVDKDSEEGKRREREFSIWALARYATEESLRRIKELEKEVADKSSRNVDLSRELEQVKGELASAHVNYQQNKEETERSRCKKFRELEDEIKALKCSYDAMHQATRYHQDAHIEYKRKCGDLEIAVREWKLRATTAVEDYAASLRAVYPGMSLEEIRAQYRDYKWVPLTSEKKRKQC